MPERSDPVTLMRCTNCGGVLGLAPSCLPQGGHDHTESVVYAPVQAVHAELRERYERDHQQYADEAEGFEVRIDELTAAIVGLRERLLSDKAVEAAVREQYTENTVGEWMEAARGGLIAALDSIGLNEGDDA